MVLDASQQDPAELEWRIDLIDASLIDVVRKLGWAHPTPVQNLCLPHTLIGRDVAGFAQTGTGKTGVFLITVAQRYLKSKANPDDAAKRGAGSPLGVVLVPTRELAMQIESDAQPLCEPLGMKVMAVFGGMDYQKQLKQIRDGCDIIVATPGRLKDYFEKKEISFDHCQTFVCDEADRMFDMGFIDDVEFFFDKLPEKTQRLLFSATTNENVKELAFEYLERPLYVMANPETITPENIVQHAVMVDSQNKLKVLLGMLRDHAPECSIVFTNTKLVAEWLHFKLVHNGIDADIITGDLPQKKRIQLIKTIKDGKLKALIATDVASRGLHIAGVTHVYNFDLPDEAANYVHRIGRTARAGAKGCAYSLVCDDYGQNLTDINQLLGEELALKSQWYDENYLQIVDKAGDPFANRTAPERSAPRSSRSNEGPERSRGGRSGARSRDTASTEPRSGSSREKNPRRQERSPQHVQNGHRKHPDQHGQGARKSQKRPGSVVEPSRHAPEKVVVEAAKVAVPTLGGVLKRVFSSIFGKKK